jgi:hypothetical protein
LFWLIGLTYQKSAQSLFCALPAIRHFQFRGGTVSRNFVADRHPTA